MAQLIKLQDYISRYEQDIYRYPAQYIKMKKQQWERIHESFLAQENEKEPPLRKEETERHSTVSIISRFKKLFMKEEEPEEEPVTVEKPDMLLNIPFKPETEDDLKISFLNQIFHFQMKWATSTIQASSLADGRFYLDEKLKFFLQRMPDTVLIMYRPVFQLKKATVETDTIMITPTETWCITFLESENNAVYLGSKDTFWERKGRNGASKKILNPHISLQRAEDIVKQIYKRKNMDIPVKKAVISREGYIDYPDAPIGLHLLDKKRFPEWFGAVRKSRSPLKGQQLKGAEALLDYCRTISVRRTDWDEEDGHGHSGGSTS